MSNFIFRILIFILIMSCWIYCTDKQISTTKDMKVEFTQVDSTNFFFLKVVDDNNQLSLDRNNIITITGDTMLIIKQMIRAILKDNTLEFGEPDPIPKLHIYGKPRMIKIDSTLLNKDSVNTYTFGGTTSLFPISSGFISADSRILDTTGVYWDSTLTINHMPHWDRNYYSHSYSNWYENATEDSICIQQGRVKGTVMFRTNVMEKMNVMTSQEEILKEIEKCKNNPYYFATKYLIIKNHMDQCVPFTTSLNEIQFNQMFKEYETQTNKTKG